LLKKPRRPTQARRFKTAEVYRQASRAPWKIKLPAVGAGSACQETSEVYGTLTRIRELGL